MIAAVVLILFSDPIVSLFGTNADMVLLAGSILSLSRQGIFFFPLIIILPQLLGLTGVISVQPMADLLTTAITIVFAVKIKKDLSHV